MLRFLPSRLTVREIADELYVSVNTLKFHLKVIYRKLGVTSRAEAAAWARRLRTGEVGAGGVAVREPRLAIDQRPSALELVLREQAAHARSASTPSWATGSTTMPSMPSSCRPTPEGGRASRSGRSLRVVLGGLMSGSSRSSSAVSASTASTRLAGMRSPATIRPPACRAAAESGSAQRSSVTTTTPAVPAGGRGTTTRCRARSAGPRCRCRRLATPPWCRRRRARARRPRRHRAHQDDEVEDADVARCTRSTRRGPKPERIDVGHRDDEVLDQVGGDRVGWHCGAFVLPSRSGHRSLPPSGYRYLRL